MKKIFICIAAVILISSISYAAGPVGRRACTDAEIAAGTSETPCVPTPKNLADEFQGAPAEGPFVDGDKTEHDTLVNRVDQDVTNGSSPTFNAENFTGVSALVDECKGQTFQTFGSSDTTPDTSNGGTGVYPCWQVHQSTSPTIIDFDDGDDHSEFAAGDKFLLLVNYTAVIDFSDNSNIEGNSNVDFTGSASQIVYLLFQFDGTRWIEHNLPGKSSPNVLSVNKISSSAVVVSDADGINLTDSDCGKYILMTGAGEVGMPDCDSDLIGCFFTIKARDAAEAIEAVMFGDTTNDLFVLEDGTSLDANDEADLATGANNRFSVMCQETNKWYIEEIKGDVSDGGVAD